MSKYVEISGNLNQPYEYVGREGYYREEFDLYLLGVRWYDSEAGRFISRDLILKTNLYFYVSNNPVILTDSLGLDIDSNELKNFLVSLFSESNYIGYISIPSWLQLLINRIGGNTTLLACSACVGCLGGTLIGCLGATDYGECIKEVVKDYWEDIKEMAKNKDCPNWREGLKRIHSGLCAAACSYCFTDIILGIRDKIKSKNIGIRLPF